MNRKVKRILLIPGIIILLIIAVFAAYMIRFKLATKSMTPVETMRIVDNIYSIKDSFVNLFLIKDGEQFIAIDGGNDADVIEKEMGKLKINPDKITAVFLTHTDNDHIAAIKLCKNARIFISRQEEQMINGKKSRFLFFKNTIFNRQYELVDDQRTVTMGNTLIRGILTPGHTPGSMCWLVNNKYLFTGDVLGLKNGKIAEFSSFFNMDSEAASRSVDKIAKLTEPEYLFTAHYGYTGDFKNAVKDWGK